MPKAPKSVSAPDASSSQSLPPSIHESYQNRRRSQRNFARLDENEVISSRRVDENREMVVTSTGSPRVREFGVDSSNTTNAPQDIRGLAKLKSEKEALRKNLDRTKKKLSAKVEEVEDLQGEVLALRAEITELEAASDQKDEELEKARQDIDQYRRWWLNEIQFTKLLLEKLPDPNKDIDLVRASQAHYLGHY